MTVRTKQLAIGLLSVAGTDTVIYTCPTDRTAIIKDVRLMPRATSPGLLQLWVKSGSAEGFVLRTDPATSLTIYVVQGFIVLDPGDQLLLRVGSVTTFGVNYVVSGSELDGVAP